MQILIPIPIKIMDHGDDVDQKDANHQSLVEADAQMESSWSLPSATISLDLYPGHEVRILLEHDIVVE